MFSVTGAIYIFYFMLFRSFSGLIALILTVVLLYFAMKSLRRSGIFKRIFMAGLIIVAGPPILMITLSLLNELVGTSTYRFRLTLEVETPEGLKTGSSVIQVSSTRHLLHWNPSASSSDTHVKGEAIFLDLGQGKNVIATLGFGEKGMNMGRIKSLPAYALGHSAAGIYEKAPAWEGRGELKGENIPILVSFANPEDPTTIIVVAPDQFEQIYGQGYRFKGMWLEMTKDSEMNTSIEHKLPWVFNMLKLTKYTNGHIETPFGDTVNYSIGLFINRN